MSAHEKAAETGATGWRSQAATVDPTDVIGRPCWGAPQPPPPPPPRRFADARYLTSGGLGDLFVADDTEVPREVALKRIQAVRADDPQARAEFAREARLTGALEHPGIVPVYGFGHDEAGRPYYAMRLISGQTLRDAARGFHDRGGKYGSVAFHRLVQSVITVCQAADFAHSRGIIHRDIKPTNVMLGPFGETLLLDWGLAKPFLEPDVPSASPGPSASPEPTREGNMKGTPGYMAPEQASGPAAALRPACDIYALGGVLFHLLTGHSPWAGEEKTDIVDRLGKGQIPCPRDVRTDAPAALDAVCRKAMAHDPAARYDSAGALAADLERWLADEPVLAYREPLRRRAARWARRRPGAVSGVGAALAVGLVALAVGLTVLSGKNAELQAANGRADARFRLASDAVEQYLSAVAEDPELTERGLHGLRRRLLETAVPFYRRLTDESGDGAARREAQAAAHGRLGFVSLEVGDAETARRECERAIEIRAGLAEGAPPDPAGRAEMARDRDRLGQVLRRIGDVSGAAREHAAALAILQELAAESPDEPAHRAGAAESCVSLAQLRWQAADAAGAERLLRAALELREGLLAESPGSAPCRAGVAGVRNALGLLYYDTRRRHRAAAEYRAALAQREALVRETGGAREHRQAAAAARVELGVALADDDGPAAMDLFRDALAERGRLAADFPAVPAYRHELVATHDHIADLRRRSARWEEAEREFRLALDLREKLVADFPGVPRYHQELGKTHANRGYAFRAIGRAAEALKCQDRALECLLSPAAVTPDERANRLWVADARHGRALALRDLKRYEESLAEWDRAAAVTEPDRRHEVRAPRLICLARAGRHDAAEAEAEALFAERPFDAKLCYDLACALALASTDPARREARRARAVEILRASRDGGFFNDAWRLMHAYADPDFAALRGRADFQALLGGIGPERLPAPRAK